MRPLPHFSIDLQTVSLLTLLPNLLSLASLHLHDIDNVRLWLRNVQCPESVKEVWQDESLAHCFSEDWLLTARSLGNKATNMQFAVLLPYFHFIL